MQYKWQPQQQNKGSRKFSIPMQYHICPFISIRPSSDEPYYGRWWCTSLHPSDTLSDCCHPFYAPASRSLKGQPRASSNWIVHPSVCNSIPLTYKVQYLKWEGRGGWYSYQTWTAISSKGYSSPTHAPGVGVKS